jgi:hypothetical protein
MYGAPHLLESALRIGSLDAYIGGWRQREEDLASTLAFTILHESQKADETRDVPYVLHGAAYYGEVRDNKRQVFLAAKLPVNPRLTSPNMAARCRKSCGGSQTAHRAN